MSDIASIASPHWKGPCTDDPVAWDLDVGTLTQWLAALRICRNHCPMLRQCEQARQEFLPLADPRRPAFNPKGVIWAGIAYSETGHVLSPESLQRLATLRRNRNAGPVRRAGGTERARQSIAC